MCIGENIDVAGGDARICPTPSRSAPAASPAGGRGGSGGKDRLYGNMSTFVVDVLLQKEGASDDTTY